MPNLPSEVEGIAWCIAFMLEAVYIVLGNFRTHVLFAVKKRFRKSSLFLVINSNINHDEIHTTLKFTTGREFQFPVSL